MLDVWTNLTEGQGLVIGASIASVGALIGFLVSTVFFSGKTRQLDQAIDKTSNVATEFAKKTKSLTDQIDSMADVLRQIRSQVQNENGEKDSEAGDLRSRLKTAWHTVRDAIEASANNPEIHGQTRNRYNRLHRYNYIDLINALHRDNNAGDHVNTFYSANELWQKHKTAKAALAENDVRRMELFAEELKSAA